MKRPRRRKLEESLVRMIITTLENELDPQYGRKRYLERLKIHKQPSNKYYRLFIRLIDYLEGIRGDYKNPIEELIKDYLTVVYKHFNSFNRMPTLLNFSPSVNNKVMFEEYIYEFTANHLEEYWISELTEAPEIIHVPIIPEETGADIGFIEV